MSDDTFTPSTPADPTYGSYLYEIQCCGTEWIGIYSDRESRCGYCGSTFVVGGWAEGAKNVLPQNLQVTGTVSLPTQVTITHRANRGHAAHLTTTHR